MQTAPKLNPDNYSKGFLVDEELMGGVAPHPDQPGLFVAFVLRHTTGEYLGYQAFEVLDEALQAINSVNRTWAYDQAGGCGGGNCGQGRGACNSGKCGQGQCGIGACAVELPR
jgi:hypothetical protein